jgi:DNA polymerase-4/DNA polymerase IV (DinB-like DNA polymerase)
MDAFYASVEIRDNPALKGKPLIIGSMPNERGVVATCSYEARKFGIHSGMNIKDAYRLCPNGIYMHPNFDKYKSISSKLHKIWNSYASASETIALDEAYLDVKKRAKTFDGARNIANEIKQRTLKEVGLTCSVGLGYSKTAAKTASEEKKPNGYFEILTPEDFVNLIIDRNVNVLYTVGTKTAQKLNNAGIITVRDIREQKERVIKLLGKQGEWITNLAYGIDDRKVTPYNPEDAKSISREITFQEDVMDYDLLKDVIFLISFCVDRRVKKIGLYGKGVVLKITYGNMKKITRSKLVPSCDSAISIYQNAIQLLDNIEKQSVRLVGVGIYNLSDAYTKQLSFDDILNNTIELEDKLQKDIFDKLQKKYGLDFAGHLEELYHLDTLHKTAEYMRKHKQKIRG